MSAKTVVRSRISRRFTGGIARYLAIVETHRVDVLAIQRKINADIRAWNARLY